MRTGTRVSRPKRNPQGVSLLRHVPPRALGPHLRAPRLFLRQWEFLGRGRFRDLSATVVVRVERHWGFPSLSEDEDQEVHRLSELQHSDREFSFQALRNRKENWNVSPLQEVDGKPFSFT